MLYPNAILVGVWVQIFMTGVYLAFLPRCLPYLWPKDLRRSGFPWLSLACVSLFVLTITSLICSFISIYGIFAVRAPGQQTDPNAAIVDEIGSPQSIVGHTDTIVLAIISDVIMVYRTFVIWNKNRLLIVVPSLLVIGDVALGVWSCWAVFRLNGIDSELWSTIAHVATRNFLVVTLCVNLLCAGLIAWKVWCVQTDVDRNLRKVGPSPCKRVIRVILESAALYCAHLLLLIICDSLGSNLYFVFLRAVRHTLFCQAVH
ncbi:hypothetical protein C8Q76DRAFT_404719 [Earliella scabrosa]|nr:hypothetical protein C8Q76DRAFT_404719 [Earliella scabrosa]